MKQPFLKDGWHCLKGSKALIKGGKIQRIIVCERYKGDRLAMLMRKRGKTWVEAGEITVSAFYAGLQRGTIQIMEGEE